MKKSKIVVYTALFGNYSGLIEQPKIKGVDYICYTDQDLKSKSWKVIKVEPPIPGDNTRSNRYYKILPHKHLKEHRISVYIDANYLIIGNFTSFVFENLTENSILCFDHNQTVFDKRDCIYDEFEELFKMANEYGVVRDSPQTMKEQIVFFREENYPDHNGLIFAAVLIRKHLDKDIIKLMELWWSFVKNRSKRDQLSFNYCLWKLKFNRIAYIDGDLRAGNPWFRWIEHKLNFKKDLARIKREVFIKKNFPFMNRFLEPVFVNNLLFYLNFPITLIKFNKWVLRYSESPISKKEKLNLLNVIISKKLNKNKIKELIINDSQKKHNI